MRAVLMRGQDLPDSAISKDLLILLNLDSQLFTDLVATFSLCREQFGILARIRRRTASLVQFFEGLRAEVLNAVQQVDGRKFVRRDANLISSGLCICNHRWCNGILLLRCSRRIFRTRGMNFHLGNLTSSKPVIAYQLVLPRATACTDSAPTARNFSAQIGIVLPRVQISSTNRTDRPLKSMPRLVVNCSDSASCDASRVGRPELLYSHCRQGNARRLSRPLATMSLGANPRSTYLSVEGGTGTTMSDDRSTFVSSTINSARISVTGSSNFASCPVLIRLRSLVQWSPVL